MVTKLCEVAIAQKWLVDLLARNKPKSNKGAVPVPDEPELDRTFVPRVFNVLATLGPLATAIVSVVFGR
jgi:hypothetical protein